MIIFYFIVFCLIGLGLGYFIKNGKVCAVIIALITGFWFLKSGIWGFATLIELVIGYAMGEKMRLDKVYPGPKPGDSTYTNSIGMKFIRIPAGTFTRTTDYIGNSLETPQKVIITKPFYLGVYPVTQEQWEKVMGKTPEEGRLQWQRNNTTIMADAKQSWAIWKNENSFANPSLFVNPKHPVEAVPWEDANEFIQRLNKLEGHTNYRLPTSMEWELAARGKNNKDAFLVEESDENRLAQYAWYSENADSMTHPVGEKKRNSFGLYDIVGNVSEWMQDYYSENEPKGELIDFQEKRPSQYHVHRGGRSLSGDEYLRINDQDSYFWEYLHGFRVAFSAD